MAKQNSKYFADVIAKLLAAKRKENIVIDEDFKTQLRANVMGGNVNSVGEMEGLGGDDKERFDWGGLFYRWRLVFGIVPAVLVVAVVAAQVMSMQPVDIESDVVVESGEVAALADIAEDSVQEVMEVVEEEEHVHEEEHFHDEGIGEEPEMVKKIKTFPGRLALPVDIVDVEVTELAYDDYGSQIYEPVSQPVVQEVVEPQQVGTWTETKVVRDFTYTLAPLRGSNRYRGGYYYDPRVSRELRVIVDPRMYNERYYVYEGAELAEAVEAAEVVDFEMESDPYERMPSASYAEWR